MSHSRSGTALLVIFFAIAASRCGGGGDLDIVPDGGGGTIAGLAGVLLTARTTSGNPINGRGLELQAITAVFLGGAATAGGRGTVVATFLAVILVGVLSNG